MSTRVRFLLSLAALLGSLAVGGRAEDGAAASARPAPEALNGLRQRVEHELRGDILKFWIQHTVDKARGGFFGEISNDLRVSADAERGALLTSRILWTYSAAYRRYHNPSDLQMARWAYDDLMSRFWDRDFGGLFWSTSAEGAPRKVMKQVYGQVFGIYALSEYFRATGEQAALDRAIQIYRLLESHARDPKNGGYFEVCTRDWTREANLKRSALEPLGAKSQNTHLHVMEAYTNLLRVWPDRGLRSAHRDLMEVMMTRILDPKTHHLVLFLDEDWTPRTDEISFGHDIEFSWLIVEAAEVQGDPALLAKAREVSLQVADAVRNQGVDRDGALVYEATPRGVSDRSREWWPQAEAAVGFLNAYELSGDPRYAELAAGVWGFIDARLVDHKYGEWFRAVDARGKVVASPKVSLWKCPYHNGRSCFELIERLEKLGAK
ncbi:N-acyl-D-glucosamine 2-epimerase [Opitutaceae bacterium EW11]|nr:N-acyl-D-glucosamine 2-epimerase [Opitutaceae bacterium EW11]